MRKRDGFSLRKQRASGFASFPDGAREYAQRIKSLAAKAAAGPTVFLPGVIFLPDFHQGGHAL
jgi:hypothetical protein